MRMLRFAKRADYGLMAIHYIAIHDEGAVSAKRIAEEFSIPQELLAKILQKLARQGLIVSQNGPKGRHVRADGALQPAAAGDEAAAGDHAAARHDEFGRADDGRRARAPHPEGLE